MNRFHFKICAAYLCLALICAFPAAAQLTVGGKLETKPVLPSPKHVVEEVRSYRLANEDRIIRELREFLSIPNVASDAPNIEKNAARLKEMLEARGIETHLLSIEGRGPVVFGKLDTLGATRTIIFYAHYDGQPVDPAAWTDKSPFTPVLRDNSIEAGGKPIPFPDANTSSQIHPASPASTNTETRHSEQSEVRFSIERFWLDESLLSSQRRTAGTYADDWRIYARSASDDKSPIIAILATLDALRAKNIPLAVNLKLVLEGEEEAGSTHLQQTLQLHKNLLQADLLITGDGPVHQSGRPLVFFGNRGDIGLDLTVYGPIRSLHSGHYGNWAPNPAMTLSRLLASMKDDQGRVLIPGYYDDVVPLSPLEQAALNAMPVNDPDLQRELGIAKPDGGGKKLVELLQQPSLNIRGIRSGSVGEQATNIVPDKAEASLEARLVKGEDPQKKFDQIASFIRKQGFFLVDHDPTIDERRAHTLIAKIINEGGYRASRTRMDLPASKALVRVMQDATNNHTVVAPLLGGSVPMYIFEDLGLPWIGVPIVNYDNHQHSSDENLRLGNLWQGIETYATLLADLDW